MGFNISAGCFKAFGATRNQADALVHQVEKALKDLGEKVSGEERAKAESALADLKSAMKGDDHDVIAKKTEALAQASASIAQKAYAGAEGAGAGAGAAPGGSESAGASGAAGADNVVDAEFEEVSDKDKGRKAS